MMASLPQEMLILVGGFGTRLRSVVNDVPKPMAPVAGHPFLEYLLDYWIAQGVRRFVLSVGYILTAIGNDYGFENIFSRQLAGKLKANDVFLGITTSGRSPNILKALEQCRTMGVLIIVFLRTRWWASKSAGGPLHCRTGYSHKHYPGTAHRIGQLTL